MLYAAELKEHYWTGQSLASELEERERQVRELAEGSIRAQEEERQWIAYEVHDRIAQTLASVFQQLQKLESMTRSDPEVRQVAVRASILLREAIRESRNIMNDLHPPVLDEFGVEPLIQQELRHFRQETGCKANLDANYQTRPPREVEVVLYRIFHEALTNVRKHAADAKDVSVSLFSTGGTVDLGVEDDGPGFNVEAAARTKRVGGLLSMARRAEIIGGRCEVISALGQGTKVSVRIPLAMGYCKERSQDGYKKEAASPPGGG